MILPDVGFTIPVIRLNNVVLPAPLGPIIPMTSPGLTLKLISDKAVNPSKEHVTSIISIAFKDPATCRVPALSPISAGSSPLPPSPPAGAVLARGPVSEPPVKFTLRSGSAVSMMTGLILSVASSWSFEVELLYLPAVSLPSDLLSLFLIVAATASASCGISPCGLYIARSTSANPYISIL